eukprot:CAMPEP_0179359012 /NCGR_PEP_ID=MMETSP0797-20121207/79225_1 /TAXON_ID=47934 /ORGANISM="Dinophysis acuminata, Strain DAEP01" /LENGTH=45 /DNA_ID= /DNA_START= /DNA_END= /DNA_ORIENTATION=
MQRCLVQAAAVQSIPCRMPWRAQGPRTLNLERVKEIDCTALRKFE